MVKEFPRHVLASRYRQRVFPVQVCNSTVSLKQKRAHLNPKYLAAECQLLSELSGEMTGLS